MLIVLLVITLAATVLLPVIFFKNLKRLKPWLGFCLLLGAVAMLIVDFFLADAILPGIVDSFFGSIQIIIIALGLGLLWYFGLRNLLRALGQSFWLWIAGAVVLGVILGLLGGNLSLFDAFTKHSALFGDYFKIILGVSGSNEMETHWFRIIADTLLMVGLMAGVGIGLGGKNADTGKSAQ